MEIALTSAMPTLRLQSGSVQRMAIMQKLALRQSQSLIMTPQLSQSIKLLAMSNIELSTFVESEIERNPFLERGTHDEPTESRNVTDLETAGVVNDDKGIKAVSGQENVTSVKELAETLGGSLENVYQDDSSFAPGQSNQRTKSDHQETYVGRSGLTITSGSAAHDANIADFTANPVTLRDHLLGQLVISSATEQCQQIAKLLIGYLDDAGYLRTDIDEIVQRLNCDQRDVAEAIELIQTFEPVGIGARTLVECLTLQLKDRGRFDPAIEAVLANLDLLANRDFEALKRSTGLSVEDISDILLEIRALDPKPGSIFEIRDTQQIVPDIMVQETAAGTWKIELNSETLPRVLVDEEYVAEVSDKVTDKEAIAFVGDCLQTANWLTRSLDQRANTILKVATEIVKRQDEFLAFGVSHLKPLTLQQVAEEIDMHESSVSRVTSNKYMLTPRGLFELKYFFTTSIAGTTDGVTHSAEAVRDQIQRLIAKETAQTILSDDAIVSALQADGIDIARRTIAKYREALHIPSSVQRRREKKMLEMIAGEKRNASDSIGAH